MRTKAERMIFINIIIVFLLGIVFIQWIFPLVDGLIGLFLTQFEVWKNYMAVKIAKSQQQIEELKEKTNNNNNLSQIGFAVLEEEEEEESNG